MRRLVLGFLFAILFWPLVASADNPTAAGSSFVTIGVGDTVMIIAGLTSPGAFVTITDFGQTVGTTEAAPDGSFSLRLPAQHPEIHKPAVFAEDTDGVFTDTVLLPVSLFDHSETTVNFFLPPTMRVAGASPGVLSRLHGQTVPGISVVLTIDNQFSATVMSDSSGVWSYDIDSANLRYGTHTVTVTGLTGTGDISAISRKLDFLVARTPAGPVVVPPPVSPSPAPVSPPPVGSVGAHQPIIIIPGNPIKVGFPTPQTVELPITVVPDPNAPNKNVQISVDWGDGKSDTYYLDTAQVKLLHHYDRVGDMPIQLYAWTSAGEIEQFQWNVRLYTTMDQINRILQLSFLLAFLIYLLETEARRRQLAHGHHKVEKKFGVG